ncbi:MAG: hypothetical protein GX377_00755, partial [Erysipelotrichaceae bacterium]|nr:hypothetical protein [Erysipelotrichaceae bacterium]
KLKNNVEQLNTDPESYVDSIIDSDDYFKGLGRDVLIDAIPRLDIEYKSALEAKADLTLFFDYLISVDTNLIGATSLDESFFRS